MKIEFDDTEVQLLEEVLGQHLRTLLTEIAHADDRAFRDQLRLRHEQVDAIRHRLTRRAA